MTRFEKEFYQPFDFSKPQIERYFRNALRDLEIAQKDKFHEVRFTYCYQALIKAGIALMAKKGSVKIRSIPGHHIKILIKMSEIMKNEDIFTIGNAMRMKRNKDFYGGGELVSKKETDDYVKFVQAVIKDIGRIISS